MLRVLLLSSIAALLMAALWLAVRAPRPSDGPPDRTVVLSMSRYAFNGTNPTLVFRPGERVRFLIRNDEDTHVVHDFRLVGIAAPPESAIAPGETRALVVTMPRPGRYGYACATHRGMGGSIVVVEYRSP